MIYETGEYDVRLDIPTDNFVVRNLFNNHLEEGITQFMRGIPLKDSETVIILLGAFHCIQERDFWVKPLNEFCRSMPNPVIVFTGKLTGDDPNDLTVPLEFAFHRVGMFDLVSNIHCRPSTLNSNKKHKFYWASSKDWYTRRYILAGLVQNNLLENNLVNYKCVHTDIPGDWSQRRLGTLANLVEQECDSIKHLVPLPAIDNTVEFMQTNIDFYLDSYLGIVIDTFYDTGVFISEKVYNAMNYHQMFFYLGHQGTLSYLRKQGYETFDNIIDTRYDAINDPGRRLIAARNSLTAFLTQPIEKIKSAYEHAIPAIEHNKQLLQKQRPDLIITKHIENLLNES
jgi:hypothetical protein